jgi:hypothetical protein
MTIPRWSPRTTVTKQEQLILARLHRTRKLFGFLRLHRAEIFDDAFQDELAAMYRDTGAGKEPVAPALLAMVVLLQAYVRASDAEAVELALMDRRWQLVLDCAGAEAPVFSQGALRAFRERLIATDLDRRVLERTVEVARQSQAFDARKLPTTLRVAIDSRPLEGAGRVEDTINLLGHAARTIVVCVADLLGWPFDRVCTAAGIPLLTAPSLKTGLDAAWHDAGQKAQALQDLDAQLTALQTWVTHRLPAARAAPAAPLGTALATLHQIHDQDLVRDRAGRVQIRQGVAPDRRISITDPEMRHGRKSKSKRFDGFKQHVATDLDTDLILAAAADFGNRPDADGAAVLHADLARQGFAIGALYIDLGYLGSPVVTAVTGTGGTVICRPWPAHNSRRGLFAKGAFRINVRDRTITCPAGQTEDIRFGTVIEFDATTCDACPQRSRCTTAAPGHGRTISIAVDEPLQKRLRAQARTPAGRERLRERVVVEHSLARIAQRQGPRARYRGVRKNTFDLRRVAAIQNLETYQRVEAAALAIAA